MWLFYDFLVEEGVRESNPVGHSRDTPRGGMGGGGGRGLVPRMVKLPWIPAEQQWLDVLGEFRAEPVRNRVMLALAYDAALRREELCSLRTDDVDQPAGIHSHSWQSRKKVWLVTRWWTLVRVRSIVRCIMATAGELR